MPLNKPHQAERLKNDAQAKKCNFSSYHYYNMGYISSDVFESK
jgi:hypothetical protein